MLQWGDPLCLARRLCWFIVRPIVGISAPSSAGFPPLPEPRLTGLGGGAGGRPTVSERSELIGRPLKVGSLGVSTEAGAAFFWFLFLAEQEKGLAAGLPPANQPGLTWVTQDQRERGCRRSRIPPAPLCQRGEPRLRQWIDRALSAGRNARTRAAPSRSWPRRCGRRRPWPGPRRRAHGGFPGTRPRPCSRR